jgi:hypothetical protein
MEILLTCFSCNGMTHYPLTQTRPVPWIIYLFLEQTKANFFFGVLPSSCVAWSYMLIV